MKRKNDGEHKEQQPDDQLVFLEGLVDGHAGIDGDVLEIDAHTWAIHGSIPVDGNVILAEYDTLDEGTRILNELFGAEPAPQSLHGSNHPGAPSPSGHA